MHARFQNFPWSPTLDSSILISINRLEASHEIKSTWLGFIPFDQTSMTGALEAGIAHSPLSKFNFFRIRLGPLLLLLHPVLHHISNVHVPMSEADGIPCSVESLQYLERSKRDTDCRKRHSKDVAPNFDQALTVHNDSLILVGTRRMARQWRL
jgi:hypothetical protein